MITKSDWEAVRQQFERQNHRMPDEPPTNEELFAYTRGELRGAAGERVREYLAANPDIARALTEPFPEDDAKPGDLGYVSPEDLDKHWTLLQEEIHGSGVAPAAEVPIAGERGWRWATMALAAMLALAVFGNIWQARKGARVVPGDGPRVAGDSMQLLPEEGTRGVGSGPSHTLPLGKGLVTLELLASGSERSYAEYRLDIIDVRSNEVVDRLTGFHRAPNESLTLLLERDDLAPGSYEIRLYGLDGTEAKRLETYSLQVR